MIKRIVFDLDNTLIMWNDEYYNTLDETFNYFNISYDEDIKNKLIKAVDDYESLYNTFDYKNMNDLMKQYSNIDLPHNFVETWTQYLEYAVPNKKNQELIETLEYLSNKYELVVLTNWFTKQQKNRLKNYGILKYFNDVIGTDNIRNKPNKDAYIKACGLYDLNECVMVGDSLENDVKGALNAGMKAILFDYKNNCKENYKIINKISDLKNIL